MRWQEGIPIGLALALLVFVLTLLPSPARCQVIVTDGDSLSINSLRVRLYGIDAPELSQVCTNGWLAGAHARATLTALLDRKAFYCAPRGSDRYGRTLATCYADGVDVGAEMVRQGMAWSFTRYSRDYAYQEQVAREAGLGVHGAGCAPPWQWRAQKR